MTAPFPLYAATTPMSGCWHAPLRCQPGNLRLPFRLVRTGICTTPSSRRTTAIRRRPPTRQRTDERTDYRPWHSLHLSPRAVMAAALLQPHPDRGLRYGFYRSIRQSLAPHNIVNSEHLWPRFRFSPLRLKTASVCGSRDYDLRLALRFSPTPFLRRGVGRVCLRLRS